MFNKDCVYSVAGERLGYEIRMEKLKEIRSQFPISIITDRAIHHLETIRDCEWWINVRHIPPVVLFASAMSETAFEPSTIPTHISLKKLPAKAGKMYPLAMVY